MFALRFRVEGRNAASISPNFLRGRFGKALRDIDRGAYERWFAPRAVAGPSGLRDSPRAFVIRTAQCEFGLNLFDVRDGAAELAVETFKRVADVHTVSGGEPLRLPLESTRKASRVRVSFVTPTELKPAERPEFAILFARLRDRISTLRALYQGGPLDIDFKGTAERAARVAMTRCEIARVDDERVSRNTGQRHSLGGFIGTAEYEGELGEFLPYLEIGRYTGVGRQTVWGKGEIHAVVA